MKWEYKRKVITKWLGDEIEDDKDLKSLGDNGWEIVTIVPYEESLVVYAKRPKNYLIEEHMMNMKPHKDKKLIATNKGYKLE